MHLDVSANHTFGSMTDDRLYQGSTNRSYECTDEKTIQLSGNGSSITVDFKQLMISPFNVTESKFPNRKLRY